MGWAVGRRVSTWLGDDVGTVGVRTNGSALGAGAADGFIVGAVGAGVALGIGVGLAEGKCDGGCSWYLISEKYSFCNCTGFYPFGEASSGG